MKSGYSIGPMRPRRVHAGTVILALAALFAMSACGTRISHRAIVAQTQHATVSLDPASIAALRTTATTANHVGVTAGVATAAPGGTPAVAVRSPMVDAQRRGAAEPSSRSAPNVAPAQESSGACASAGSPLRLGQVGAFSGVTGPIALSGRVSLATWVQAVNARGGVACHPVELYSVDDGADSSRAAAEVQDLVERKHIQALIGVFDVIGFAGILSAVQKLKIPVIGGDSADFAWNDSPYLFPTGAGTEGVIAVALHEIHRLGRTTAGLIYCVEATLCTRGAKVLSSAAPNEGLNVVYSAPVSVTQPDYTAQCLNAKNAGAQMIGVLLDGSSIGRVARSCAAINYHPLLFADAIVFTKETAQDPEVRRDNVGTVTPVAPWLLDDTAGQREYHAAMSMYSPTAPIDATSIQVWAAGKLLEATVAGLGPRARTTGITTADLFTGLGAIHDQTLGGLVPPITFAPGQKAARSINCAYFEVLTDKGWTTPDGVGSPAAEHGCARRVDSGTGTRKLWSAAGPPASEFM